MVEFRAACRNWPSPNVLDLVRARRLILAWRPEWRRRLLVIRGGNTWRKNPRAVGNQERRVCREKRRKARKMDLERSVLRDMADEPCRRRPGERHDLCRRRQRVVRSSRVEVHRFGKSWTHSSEGLAYEEGKEPVKAVWSLASRNGSLYAGVKPAGLFRSDDGGQSWSHIEGLQKHPTRRTLAARRRRADPAFAGRLIPTTPTRSGSACRPRACSTPPMAARPGSRATRARAPISCPKAALPGIWTMRALPGEGARRRRAAIPAEPLRHVSRATTAARAGTASRPVCHQPSAFPPPCILATPTRCTCCR